MERAKAELSRLKETFKNQPTVIQALNTAIKAIDMKQTALEGVCAELDRISDEAKEYEYRLDKQAEMVRLEAKREGILLALRIVEG